MTAKEKIESILNEIENTDLYVSDEKNHALNVAETILGRPILSETDSEEKNTPAPPALPDIPVELNRDMLAHYISECNSLHNVSYYKPLETHRSALKKPVLFAKRLLRKLNRFIVQPITEDQNSFNSAVTSTVNILSNGVIESQNKINLLRQKQDIDHEVLKEANNSIDKINLCLSELQNRVYSMRYEADIERLDMLLTRLSMKIDNIIMSEKAQTLGSPPQKAQTLSSSSEIAENDDDCYGLIDYFDFENHFRGSKNDIKKCMECYLPYFKNKTSVIDLGCGRGEFLELMKENGISAKGVDLYDEFAEYCKSNGLDVCCGDAVKYLAEKPDCSEDGIFAGQLVEHLSTKQLLLLIKEAYRVLKPDGIFIMETPNTTSLVIYCYAFYIDPSHTKPVHPLTLDYFLEKAGFSKREVIYTAKCKELPLLNVTGAVNLAEFNDGIKQISSVLFGSQDYAMIATK